VLDSFSNYFIIFLSFSFVLIKLYWLKDTLPFIFDFVLSMIAGFIYGKWTKRKQGQDKQHRNAKRLHHLGTLSLYGFIIATVQSVISLDWSYFDFAYFLVLVVKTLLIAVFSFLFVVLVLKKLSYNEALVAIVAGDVYVKCSGDLYAWHANCCE
jgi:UDP-N-acetylmuramyl pentapeptide phosphotransferase/UDP-N-acetylglucosamine-1-phosphate transferase